MVYCCKLLTAASYFGTCPEINFQTYGSYYFTINRFPDKRKSSHWHCYVKNLFIHTDRQIDRQTDRQTDRFIEGSQKI